MKKELFIIQSYIPSDENIVVCSVYKQYILGFKSIKYIFIDILSDSGIGTKTEGFGEETAIGSLVKFLKVCGFNNTETERSYIGFCTFEEMLEIKNLQKTILESKLKT